MVFISKLRGVKVNVPQRSVAFFLFFFVVASIKIVLSKRLLLHLNEEVSQLPYFVFCFCLFVLFVWFFFFFVTLIYVLICVCLMIMDKLSIFHLLNFLSMVE